MSRKGFCHNRWVKLVFWALLYTLWVVWLGNYWWLLGLVIIFDMTITGKVNWLFWKKEYKDGEKPNALLDWLDAVIFAVVFVTFINIFFFQAFKIPSSSMENTLYTGDHLFVSKLAYGPRIPETPLTIPFTHNTIFGKESYSTLIHREYRRLKGFGDVKRGDKVVFGFPNGDTILTKLPSADYYSICRQVGKQYAETRFGPLKVRPADKKDHYVKRCVALAGDTLEVRNGLVWVNGQQQETYPGLQLTYEVRVDGQRLNPRTIDNLGLNASELVYNPALPGYPHMPLTAESVDKVKGMSNVLSVVPNIEREPSAEDVIELFPYVETGWTRDFYGPLWVPEKGAEVELTMENIPFYERIISVYEKNQLEVTADGEIRINGEKAQTYTFKQNYYFMMGDNRHNSLDSRYWGFVPEDHIVGRPVVIWLSTDRNHGFPASIRWRRFFKLV